jgi:hypothetical protein
VGGAAEEKEDAVDLVDERIRHQIQISESPRRDSLEFALHLDKHWLTAAFERSTP